jgi:hypothetical protein
MQRLTNHGNMLRSGWCAFIVLLAVCSITVSVATRYCSTESSSAYTVNTLHKHSSRETSRQRLTKEAISWIPRLICSAVLQARPSYPRITPVDHPVLVANFDKSLYNRPPPRAKFLA